jgi:hypothetical protein
MRYYDGDNVGLLAHDLISEMTLLGDEERGPPYGFSTLLPVLSCWIFAEIICLDVLEFSITIERLNRTHG